LKPAQRRIGEMSPMRKCFQLILVSTPFEQCGSLAAELRLLFWIFCVMCVSGCYGPNRLWPDHWRDLFEIEQSATADLHSPRFSRQDCAGRDLGPAQFRPIGGGDYFASAISAAILDRPEVPCISPMQVDLIGTSGDIRAWSEAP